LQDPRGSHFNRIVCLCDRVQVGQVDYRHGRWRRRLLQDATEFDIETVGGQRGRTDRDVGFPPGGNGHDLGLRVSVVTYVVGHHGRGPATFGRHCSAALAVAAIVVVAVVVPAAIVIATAVCRRPATATAATFRVSGLCGSSGGGCIRAGATRRRQRQIAYTASATADATVFALLLLLRRVDATAADTTAVTCLCCRGPVQRLEFGGHAVVYDVEAHGRQRHAGKYVYGTEPHGGRAGKRHVH